MKKIKLNLRDKQSLSKEQMRKVNGGEEYICFEVGTFNTVYITAENCCQAQGMCDTFQYSNYFYSNWQFENGCECNCTGC